MRVRLILGWLLVLSLMAAIGYAQEPAARSLSLRDALDIARRNNPDYQATTNNRWAPNRSLLNATASLFTPSATLRGSTYRVGTGEQSFGGVTFPVRGLSRQAWLFELGYQLSGASFASRGAAAADVRVAEAEIARDATLLETTVRREYLSTLQAQAQRALAQRSVERAQENLTLAQARYTVGQGTLIDVRRAEVEKGQADVGLLRADQAVVNQLLVLFQQLGVPAPEPLHVALTDSFALLEPRFQLQELIALAEAENPDLRSLRARETSARWNVRRARSQYLPSLSLSADFGQYRITQDTATATGTTPWNLFVQVSLPLYDGFRRDQQIAQARALEDDFRQGTRARQLQVRAQVTAALHTVDLSYRTIAVQERNKIASSEALELATQRYRVGSGTYIELLDARVAAERADAEYVTAVYDYHRAIAALENAVGRPLR